MKQQPKILLSFVALFALHLGMANTNGTEGKKSQTNQEQQQTNQQGSRQKLDKEPEISEKRESEKDAVQDSVKEDSVSKYNFIFHYLYKFKYDQEENY